MYNYNATLIKVIDGDTVVLNVDLGFKLNITITVRLSGVDAPELNKGDKELGKKIKKELDSLLKSGKLTVNTKKQDKYGRWLADIYVNDLHVNHFLLEKGFVINYKG